jgi:hypothetical protein
MYAPPRVLIVSEDDAARVLVHDAFLAEGWLFADDEFATLTDAIPYLQAVTTPEAAPECLLIDCRALHDYGHSAIAAIRKCEGSEALPIVLRPGIAGADGAGIAEDPGWSR